MAKNGKTNSDDPRPAELTLEGKALALAERIESLEMQIEAEQEACKEACQPMREDIAELWKEAKGGELPERAMRLYVRLRATQRKGLAKLNAPERAAYHHLREALGPLGAAAAERAGYGEDDADLRPRFKREEAASPA